MLIEILHLATELNKPSIISFSMGFSLRVFMPRFDKQTHMG